MVLLFSGAHLPKMIFHPFLAAHASAKMLFTSTGSTYTRTGGGERCARRLSLGRRLSQGLPSEQHPPAPLSEQHLHIPLKVCLMPPSIRSTGQTMLETLSP